jgi:NAD(P)-dependent dehydrogenase (short-subunit alcohol dehydrogenase family)/aryl carrier-like protein
MLTGGFGGMCLAIARHLARGARARLVLVARQALPPREAWDDAIARGEDAEVVRRILAVRGLEELGSEVLPLAADVTDAAQMASALAETQARFGALHGVLHAAGVPGGGLLQFKTREAARDVMAPKLQGTLVLGRLLQGLPLDWLVLCSSLSALVGGVGRGDYAAANAFLDAYARAFGRGSARHRVVSIDWDTWRESGMAVSAQRRAGDAGALERGLGDEQGAEAFLQALAFGRPQVAVCQDDLAAVRAHFRAGPLVSARSAFGAPSPNTSGIAPQHAPPVGHLEQVIAALWEDLLGIAPIGRDGNFFELGGHSLLGIQFVARLKDRHGVEVAIAQLFEAPTVAALAALVGGESAGALAEALTAAEALSDEDVTALLSSPESTA